MLGEETGLKRAALDAIFRELPVTTLPNHRKVYVRRDDVMALLEQRTFRNDGTAVRG